MSATPCLRHPVAAAMLCLCLPGCASLDADRCAQTDWRAAGIEDGRAGRAADAIALRADACAPRGVRPDEQGYSEGRALGLEEYCTLAGGVRAGRSGEVYADVCPDEREEEFMTGYYLGAFSADQ